MPAGFAHDDKNHCGLSALHVFEGHGHETHGHKTASSEHREEERKADEKGISYLLYLDKIFGSDDCGVLDGMDE